MLKAIIKCSKCNQSMKVPLDKGPIKITCPHCTTVFNFDPQDYKPNTDNFGLTQADIDFYNTYEQKQKPPDKSSDINYELTRNIPLRLIISVALVFCFIKWPSPTFRYIFISCLLSYILALFLIGVPVVMRNPFSKLSPSPITTAICGLATFLFNYTSYIIGSLFVIYSIIENKRVRERLMATQRYLKLNKEKFDELTPKMFDYRNKMSEYNQYLALQKKLSEEKLKKEEEKKRKRIDFWNSLSGYQFEREVANYFQKQGYVVVHMGGSGDEGIDMILNEKIIVQCKAHSKPIGRPDFQKLYGVLKDKEVKYEKAIMVCLNGVSEHAKRFIAGKNIEVVTVNEIIGNSPLMLNKEET